MDVTKCATTSQYFTRAIFTWSPRTPNGHRPSCRTTHILMRVVFFRCKIVISETVRLLEV